MGKKTDRNNYCIYVHDFPNGKKYVGQTCVDPNERWRDGKRYSGLMARAIEKYGWGNINHIVVVRGLDAETANYIERLLIQILKTTDAEYGYNITSGGDGFRGAKHSEETREILREKAREQWARQKAEGYTPPPITEEHRKHLRESHIGKTAWNKGKSTMTEEAKERLRAARRRFWDDVRNGKRDNPNRKARVLYGNENDNG